MESNWTDPFWFAVYAILRPVAHTLILVVMYRMIAGSTQSDDFACMLVGHGLYILVSQTLRGVSGSVHQDREFFHTIRYVYVASNGLFWYLMGRGSAGFVMAAFSSAVVLAGGWRLLGAPLGLSAERLPLGAAALFMGAAATALMGLGLAAVNLLAARHGESYSEAASGVLYLLVGAVFPVEVLPAWLRPVGLGLPQTYALEALRRLLVPGWANFSPTLAGLSDVEVAVRLLVSAAAAALAGLVALGAADRRARRTGALDAPAGA